MDNVVVWRDVRIDDYGIDALLEFFPGQKISGRYMPMQLKGTGKSIKPLTRPKGYVSCKIKATTYEYGLQDVLPVLILFVSLCDKCIYYGTLQEAFEYQSNLRNWAGLGKELTVHLPVSQRVDFGEEDFGSMLWALYTKHIEDASR